MTRKTKISVISSFSDDKIYDQNGKFQKTVSGGPALFIKSALDKASLDYDLITSPKLITEIKIKDGNEYGRLAYGPKAKKITPDQVNDWTIISTINGEWDLTNLPKINYLFLDIQGFVREGKHFGKKKRWPQIRSLQSNIFCLKGTEEEIAQIDSDIIEIQKNKILIVTKGPKGLDLYNKNKKYKLSATEIGGLSDTIGAGDTFLANFASGLYKGQSIIKAAEAANGQTAEFLRSKA